MKINTNALRISLSALALLIAFSPLTGLAKENENKGKKDTMLSVSAQAKVENRKENKDDNKGEDDSNNSKSSCFKAFGHLIAPGWIKKNGTTTISDDCWLPFGIHKKFRGGTTTSATGTPGTVDTIAPVISSIVSSPLQTSATVKWNTNEKSDSVVFYATTSAGVDVNSASTSRVMKSGMTKDHSVKLTGLATSTTYYFKVASKDASGNVAYSDTLSFMTKAPDVVVTYPVISNVATVISSTTVQVGWKTNEPATTKVYYGTTTPDVNLGSTAFVSDASLVTNHAITVSGLSTSTPYVFVIESKNAQGNSTFSNSFTATTNSGL